MLRKPQPGTRGWQNTLLMLSPWIVTFALFWVYPLVYSMFMSFMKFPTIRLENAVFVGLENYVRLFSDEVFLTALKNTSVFVFATIPATTVISLLLAVILKEKIPFKPVFKSALFLPTIISMVVIALIFKHLYSYDGVINAFLGVFGIQNIQWLNDTRYALMSIMIMDVWASIGYYTIIFLAGLEAVPKDLYESASVDGATKFQQFFNITVPGIRNIILFIIVINTIRSYQIFTEIMTMTQGNPLNSTNTIVYQLYETAFHNFNFGYASAMAYALFIIIMAISLIYNKFIYKEEKM